MHKFSLNMWQFYLVLILLIGCSKKDSEPIITPPVVDQTTFTNPLLNSGPDPSVIYHDSFYYYTHTLGDKIGLWRTRDITNLKNAEYRTIWLPPAGTAHSYNLWAPELAFINNNWYVYYAADDGKNENHRLYVLENTSSDPFEGRFFFKSKLETEQWAIDGSVFEHNGINYLVWSGWREPRVSTEIQRLYIAKLDNPWTVGSKRVQLSEPELVWEKNWQNPAAWNNTPPYTVYVNEGPQFLKHDNQLFIIYSASGCWTPQYGLGMLRTSATNTNLLDSTIWIKSQTPVFQQSTTSGVY
ncbi:MAG: family 43 glycosylhydrolase, partial [Saprospiraceae bacterium]